MRKTRLNEQEIIERYTTNLEPMISIAKSLNRTRQAIWYILNRHGIDTSKEGAGNVSLTCTWCGKIHRRTRARARKANQPFCCNACYFAWLEQGNGNTYIDSRRGRRQARDIASRYIDLLDGYIVHHEDRNSTNNELSNLRVFASSGDHTRYHRGFRVPIIWDGSKV